MKKFLSDLQVTSEGIVLMQFKLIWVLHVAAFTCSQELHFDF